MFVLFTDFGIGSLYVGQMHLRLRALVPDWPVVDLMHDAPCFDVADSALLLRALMPWVPDGAILLAVVDPGVGGDRDVLAVEHRRGWLLAPDNDLLAGLDDHLDVKAVWCLDEHAYGPLSASFHGRDLFAPAAAEIANSGQVRGVRVSVDERFPILSEPDPARVIHVDRYGNLYTGIPAQGLVFEQALIGDVVVPFVHTFSDVAPGEPLLYGNSLELLELAVAQGSAAQRFGLGVGDRIEGLSFLVD